MAILKKSKIGSKLMTVISVVVLLAVAVPLVSAYEAHTINVKAHVEERFNVFKVMLPADQTDIDEAVSLGHIPDPLCQPGPFGTMYQAAEVPIKTCLAWEVIITFVNVHDYPIHNVVVKDNFSAEMGAVANATAPVDFDIKWHDRGKAKKWQDVDPFATQYRVIWYVTYVDGNIEWPEDPDWPLNNGGVMQPGESVSLHLLVWTKLNPALKQEYTSPGNYTLNSGPTGKWLDLEGHQASFDGAPLNIIAIDPLNPP